MIQALKLMKVKSMQQSNFKIYLSLQGWLLNARTRRDSELQSFQVSLRYYPLFWRSKHEQIELWQVTLWVESLQAKTL
jgi:hypothetical protein